MIVKRNVRPKAQGLGFVSGDGSGGPVGGLGHQRDLEPPHKNRLPRSPHRQAGSMTMKPWLHYLHCWDASVLSPNNLARHSAVPGQTPSSTGFSIFLFLLPPLGLCPLLHL